MDLEKELYKALDLYTDYINKKKELKKAKEQEEKRKAYKIQAQITIIEQILEAFEKLEQLKGFLEVID